MSTALLPRTFAQACRRLGVKPTRHLLVVWVGSQHADWLEQARGSRDQTYVRRRRYVISTSRFGIGSRAGSNCTPLGLHRVAQKVGGGWPVGTVFRGRQPVGLTWRGLPLAPIAHRVLWLDGLEPGRNRGGEVDSFRRFIYVHGVGDELTLGRPASRGCVHLAASDLLPLYDRLPVGSLVWIAASYPATPGVGD